ncbi:MAG: peptide chain release factor N(5)-glutamine methyltransferase [Caldimonas sp.]
MNGAGSVRAAIDEARVRGVAALDAQLMLARLVGKTRTQLIAHDDAALAPEVSARWAAWLERRVGGEPLAYLLGEKEFHGLMLEVTPDVLVPRPETELLVDWALELLPGHGANDEVIDLGTGSGAIALALKHARPTARVTASDASTAALAVARRNADRLALEVEWIESSWWQGLEERRFDLVVANPPYVRAGDPALAALHHEPLSALASGSDGLTALRAIVAGLEPALRPGGWLLVEHGFDQAEDVRDLMKSAGLERIELRRDLAGHSRATGARWPRARRNPR